MTGFPQVTIRALVSIIRVRFSLYARHFAETLLGRCAGSEPLWRSTDRRHRRQRFFIGLAATTAAALVGPFVRTQPESRRRRLDRDVVAC